MISSFFAFSNALQAAEFTSKGAEAVVIDFNDHAKSVAALKVYLILIF